jgi:hypothetical protein
MQIKGNFTIVIIPMKEKRQVILPAQHLSLPNKSILT